MRRAPNVDIMTSELLSADYQLDFRGQKRPIRPKLLKLTDDGKGRKKNKFKVIIFIGIVFYFAIETNRIERPCIRYGISASTTMRCSEILWNQFKAVTINKQHAPPTNSINERKHGECQCFESLVDLEY